MTVTSKNDLPPEQNLCQQPDADKIDSAGQTAVTPQAALAPTTDPAAAKARDLDSIRKAVEDAAAVSTGLWISYLFTLFYIAIAAGAVSHLDLLLENPVKLPFLGIELPLLAFFFLAPLLFLTAHAYTLVHFVMLGKKAMLFHIALSSHFPNAEAGAVADERNREIREGIRWQLPSNIFVQFLAGPSDIRESGFGYLLQGIAWITLVFAPVALLLELQIQFLPFHALSLTWEHRLAIGLDLTLIWWLWGKILGDNSGFQPTRNWRARTMPTVGVVLSTCVVWLSCSLATIPDEWQMFTGYRPFHKALFHGYPDPNTHRPGSLFSNVLVLPYLNVYQVLKVDDPQKVAWRDRLLSVRGRDLRGAIFDEASMERTDAQSAQMHGASLSFARLQGSTLDEANLQGADLSYAQLQGASLLRAQMQGAEMSGAGLQGAKLESAKLVGANLTNVQLQAANLRGADLQGVNFAQAVIRGTSFVIRDRDTALLQGASFDEATLDTISLKGAMLWRASLKNAKIKNVFGSPNWAGVPTWGPASYASLRDSLQNVPQPQRDAALQQLERVACARPPGTPVCVVPSPLPPDIAQWQDKIVKAGIDKLAYERALAAVYADLICSGDGNSLAIFRSVANMGLPQTAGGNPTPMGFLATRSQAKQLVETIKSDRCPVSKQLTDADRATLLKDEQFAVFFASEDSADPHVGPDESNQQPTSSIGAPAIPDDTNITSILVDKKN